MINIDKSWDGMEQVWDNPQIAMENQTFSNAIPPPNIKHPTKWSQTCGSSNPTFSSETIEMKPWWNGDK